MSNNELSGNEIDALLSAVNADEADEQTDNTENEVLSSNEVDDLLSAIEDGAEEEVTPDNYKTSGPMIRIYDYVRPDLLTKSMLQRIHIKIEGGLDAAAAKIKAVTGVNLSFKINSIDMLSFDEVKRSTPNPCNMVKIEFDSGRIMLLNADGRLVNTIGNIFLGISPKYESKAGDESFLTGIFCSAVEMVYPSASWYTMVRDPYEVSTESSLEPVLAVSVDSGDYGRLDITLPLSTVIEKMPEAMKAFRLPGCRTDKWIDNENKQGTDLWFRRIFRFPIYHASYNNIAAVIENGELEMSPKLTGRVEYKTN